MLRATSILGGVSRQTLSLQEALLPSSQLGGTRDGSNLKEIRRRIKSVKSIQKITKTMKMIASSRLKEAQNRMESARPFYEASSKIADKTPIQSKKKNLIVPVCTDRGLCGGLNTSVTKQTRALINKITEGGDQAILVPIGDKGSGQLSRDQGDKVLWSAGGTGKKPLNFLGASVLADRILQSEFDNVTVIYNQFNSVISNTTVQKSFNNGPVLAEHQELFTQYEFEEDDSQFHIQDLVEFQLGSLIFNASAENSAAELGARMSAMDSATRNATDMIKKLNDTYNRGRQAAITTELTEIISGAAAVE